MTQALPPSPEEEIGRELKRRRVLATFGTFLPYWRFKDRETGKVRAFTEEILREGQREFRDAAQEHDWLLGLKAGKLGFTEIECAFDAYRLLCSPNGRVHVFSRDAAAAEKLLEYVRFGLTELPDWMGIKLLAEERGGDTGHSIKVSMGPGDVRTLERYAAGPNVSIDATCQHAHVDEFGAMPFQKQTWGAISSTIAPGGTCHVVSRGYGEGVYLAEMWYAAVDGGSRLYPLFCDWMKRDGRDEAWHRQEEANNPHGIRFFAPDTPEDCLSGEDSQVFLPIEWWDACKEDLPAFTEQNIGRTPVVLGVDAAVGRSDVADTFACVVASRHPARHNDPVIWQTVKWDPPGKGQAIDFHRIESWIRTVCKGGCAAGHYQSPGFKDPNCPACRDGVLIKGFNVVEIVYDPFQLEGMMQRINRELGVWCIPFDQVKMRNLSDRMLYDVVVERRLAHSGQLDLREHIMNARAKLQPGEDSKIRMVKKAEHKKIDLAVAASMAVYECLRLML